MSWIIGYLVGVLVSYVFALIVMTQHYRKGGNALPDDSQAVVFFAITWPIGIIYYICCGLMSITKKIVKKLGGK
ncbi:hypothetical protein vBPpSSYP_110 [Pseudomonas phage vB_PpS_SYP]|nr:hypothetical protein vBPpSSYP_110 [Pseudomonas phage vB_PpS_SYP]